MRVPNLTTYSMSTYQLGNLTGNLKDANEVMATQKRINNIYDDPVGMTQVLDIKTTLGNLDQIEKNVNMGKSWLTGGETAMDSVNSLILDAKTEVSRLINDSASADERKDAVERIDGILEQIVALGNTQVNGNYIFGGTDTDFKPFIYNEDEDPPNVSYEGNDIPFEIRTDKALGVEVGRDGSKTFWDDEVAINETNNTIVFTEDNGHGSAWVKTLTATIPDGTYTTTDLEIAVRNALNEISATEGYGATYDVSFDEDERSFAIREDGSYDGFLRSQFLWDTGGEAYLKNIETTSGINPDDVNLSILNRDALTLGTPEPHGSEPITFTWNGSDGWITENNPGYVMPYKIAGTATGFALDLDESGSSDITISFDNEVKEGESLSFEIVPELGDHSLGHEIGFNADNLTTSPPCSENRPVFITELTIVDGVNDSIDIVETNSTGGTATLSVDIYNTTGASNTYVDMTALSLEIETKLEAESLANGYGVDYAVSYDSENSRFNIREDGATLNRIDILWETGVNSAISAGSTLGYYPLDDAITYPQSDTTPIRSRIVIDHTNNMLDFEEVDGLGVSSGPLQAFIPSGIYTTVNDLETAVETAMNNGSANGVTYDVVYDDAAHQFTIQKDPLVPLPALNELHLLWSTGNNAAESIAQELGFDPSTDDNGGVGVTSYVSDNAPTLMTFDTTNNSIDFIETKIDGTVSSEQTVEVPSGDYTDLDDVAAEIQQALRSASPNAVDYIVSYDYTAGSFMIKGSSAEIKGFDLLWNSGENASNSAAEMLGFDKTQDESVTFSESDEDVVNIVIDATNNKIDFKEFTRADGDTVVEALTASVAQKTYTSYETLGLEVEKALEKESLAKGNKINYSVSWDSYTEKFTIKEKGTSLEELQILWQSGENAPISEGGSGESIGPLLGFSASDDSHAPVSSQREVEWGIFNSLIDMKAYLEENDTDGLERSLLRLESHYDNMTSIIADTGIKYNRLDVRDVIISEVNLSLTERRSSIEDADMIQSIMDLKSIETSYQAALSSTSKMLSISLVDYL